MCMEEAGAGAKENGAFTRCTLYKEVMQLETHIYKPFSVGDHV